MRKFYKIILTFFFAFSSASTLYGQNRYFTDAGPNGILPTNGQKVLSPRQYRAYTLNTTTLKNFLWSLPSENNVVNRNQAPVMELPMPDGKMAKFRVWESSIMAPELAAKFPEMRTFAGQGITDPYATIRFDYNPYFGFSAQILSAASGRIFIDPYARRDINNYMSYYGRDFDKSGMESFICGLPEALRTEAVAAGPCRGTQLFTYRLALACTGEYAVAVAGPGPTVPAVAAAMLVAVNRVTGVYETEASIRMQLVANNNNLIFLDGTTDPYTNNNGGAMLNQNITTCNTIIGSANYDIGHVFSTGGGGVAFLGVICTSSKAGGVTGLSNPVGDPFYIDYVAHEMGHQYGGNHTFNSTMSACGGGNRNAFTAYEVGSGTSIQAYAGICGNDNIQLNSDPFFHTVSFDEISNYAAGTGMGCAAQTGTGNTLPVITAMNNNGVSIPLNTPFTLTGAATDADGDALTYCWEQWDLGPATAWNGGNGNTTSPLFKSRVPKTTGSRTFPDIAVILAGYPANPPATMGGLKGETLPTQARTMKFRLTVRDNRAGGGGVVTGGDGCQAGFTGMFQINTVAGTGPFEVTVPNGGESYPGGTAQTVTWNVAGTSAAPINTTNVNILLSTDGGNTFPTTLLANTANDGSESVTIPGPATTTARIKIEAVGNIFFDISNQNFIITAPVGGFTFNNPGPITATCPAANPMTATLTATYNAPFTNNISLSAVSVPAGPVITFGTNPLTTGTPSSTVNITNASSLTPGSYTVTVTGNGTTVTQTRDIIFTVNPGAGPAVTGDPANQTICANGNTSFTVVSPTATAFKWQVNPGSGYTDIINGGVYSGAATATLVLTNVPVTFNGYLYRAVPSAQCGSTNSNPATLTVNSLPAIATQPANSTICVNGTTSFTSTGTGAGISYQWQVNPGSGFVNVVNGGVYGGANLSTLTITGALASMNGYIYHVVATGICAPPATSNNATLTVINPVVVTVQPTDKDICSGANTTYSITATSTETITYQWQVNTGSGFNDVANGGVYGGATTNTLTITGALASMDNYRYRARVNNVTCATPGFSGEGLLRVRPTPTIGLAASLTSLLPGQVSVLTATPNAPGTASNTVTWQYNAAASSVTGNTYTANVEKVGTYQTFISATYAGTLVTCSNSSPIVTIVATPSTRLFIFPSPNDGTFTVSYYNNGGASTSRMIVIFDSKGSKVYERKFNITGAYTLIPIDMRQVQRGIYYVAVGDANGEKLAEGKVHIR